MTVKSIGITDGVPDKEIAFDLKSEIKVSSATDTDNCKKSERLQKI